jgi:uncharacterized Rmd1/YagE family protein
MSYSKSSETSSLLSANGAKLSPLAPLNYGAVREPTLYDSNKASPTATPGTNTSVRTPEPASSLNSGLPNTTGKLEVRRFSATTELMPGPIARAVTTGADEIILGRTKRSGTIDEFNMDVPVIETKFSNITKALRTGRQRKKTASRTKGGEFQARRRKRRIYFCCISNDIDVEGLADEFQVAHFGMRGQMYDEVLHLYVDTESSSTPNGQLHLPPNLSSSSDANGTSSGAAGGGGNGSGDKLQAEQGDFSEAAAVAAGVGEEPLPVRAPSVLTGPFGLSWPLVSQSPAPGSSSAGGGGGGSNSGLGGGAGGGSGSGSSYNSYNNSSNSSNANLHASGSSTARMQSTFEVSYKEDTLRSNNDYYNDNYPEDMYEFGEGDNSPIGNVIRVQSTSSLLVNQMRDGHHSGGSDGGGHHHHHHHQSHKNGESPVRPLSKRYSADDVHSMNLDADLAELADQPGPLLSDQYQYQNGMGGGGGGGGGSGGGGGLREVESSVPVMATEHSKEVFVFGFGAMVYWGLAKNEVQDLLAFIEKFIVKEPFSKEEFEAGEDDMAFVTTHEVTDITIANDVITLPPVTTVKERLAVSFAIAQSAVLSIFESRVEVKIEEYKFIPEALAKCGKVDFTPKQLGVMIGEVFVMQHDVNLHSEILDLPDYFWKEKMMEPLYSMTMGYMEMLPRIAVLNKRLNLMRELLRVLQQQHENAHSVKLEWIVIWLIVISCVLEGWDIIKDVFGISFNNAAVDAL